MLSIGKLGAGQERYYLDKVAEGAEDYYSGEGEAEGQWLGRRRRRPWPLRRGRARPARPRCSTGMNPATGEPLGLREVAGRGPGPRLRPHLLRPEVGLADLGARRPRGSRRGRSRPPRNPSKPPSTTCSDNACWTRRGAGGAEFVQGNGFLAAAYLHRSSRAGDPQLHTHVLIANATKGPDGRWTRLYHPAIYDHAKTACYIYEAHLRHELTQRLGRRSGRRSARASPRSRASTDEQLRDLLHPPRGDPGGRRPRTPPPGRRQIATLTTRQAKERDLTKESLRERWQTQGRGDRPRPRGDRGDLRRRVELQARLTIDRARPRR